MPSLLDKLDRQLFGSLDKAVEASFPSRLLEKIKSFLAPASDLATPVDRRDFTLALLFGVFGAAVALWAMHLIPLRFYGNFGFDIWFQADPPRVFNALSDRVSPWHYRDNVHPLFSLIAFPPAALLRLFGLSPAVAGQVLLATAAFLNVALLYLTLRRMSMSRLVGALGCAGFVSSAAFLHWFSVIETYALSSLATILTIYIVVRTREASAFTMVLASAVSLTMVVTNWTLGIALTVMKCSLSPRSCATRSQRSCSALFSPLGNAIFSSRMPAPSIHSAA